MNDQRHSNTSSSNTTNVNQASGYDRVVDKASTAYASSVDSARTAAHRVGDGLESNPLAVLVGGLAVGALAGALLPRSDKEKELLAPVGKRLGDTARVAIAAARETATQELDGAGLTPGAARDKGKDLLGSVAKALSTAGTAAVTAAKQNQPGQNQDGQNQRGKDQNRSDAGENSGSSDRPMQA